MPNTVALPRHTTALPRIDDSQIIPCSNHLSKARPTLSSKHQLWDTLYQQHHAELAGYLQSKWGKQADEANDITHQAFERFMSVAQPQAIEQPRAYLFQLVRNLATDGLRREKVRSEHARREACDEEQASPDKLLQSLLAGEQLKALEKIIKTMPEKRRRAFVLSRVHQLSYREIAQEMDISTEGVKKHILRALDTCREQLKHQFDE